MFRNRIIKLGSERFEAPECVFQPHLVDIEQPGFAENALPDNSERRRGRHPCRALRTHCAQRRLAMCPGLPSRLEKEMKQLYLTRVLRSDPARLNVRPLAVLFSHIARR